MNELPKQEAQTDYANTGLTIQDAMVRQFKRFPEKKSRPGFLLWSGLHIHTGDSIAVPKNGRVRGEFLKMNCDVEQGFDIKIEGWLQLLDGKQIKLLRTWHDPRYQPTVEYPFHAKDGFIKIWNVYKMRYPGGRVVEETWTGNAGFWIEEVSKTERIYHCSNGMAKPPDFENLVFKITIIT